MDTFSIIPKTSGLVCHRQAATVFAFSPNRPRQRHKMRGKGYGIGVLPRVAVLLLLFVPLRIAAPNPAPKKTKNNLKISFLLCPQFKFKSIRPICGVRVIFVISVNEHFFEWGRRCTKFGHGWRWGRRLPCLPDGGQLEADPLPPLPLLRIDSIRSPRMSNRMAQEAISN